MRVVARSDLVRSGISKGVRRLTGPATGRAILAAVDHAVETRWDRAQAAAAATSGTIAERIKQLEVAFRRELTAVGAASGAAAAVPGTGVFTFVGTTAAEIGWSTLRTADLIMAIASVHGHDESSVEERRSWVLSVLAFEEAASAGFNRLAAEMGQGLGARATTRIPVDTLQQVNRALGRTVLTKYGTTRGAIALGRALPLGIGAAIGGTANNLLTRTVAKRAASFFAATPHLDAIEVDGHEIDTGGAPPLPEGKSGPA